MIRNSSALALCLLFWLTPASAHYLDIAQFSMYEQESPGEFALHATLPGNVNPSLPVDMPQGCRQQAREQHYIGDAYRVELVINCDATATGSLQTRWGRDGAIHRTYLLDGSSSSTMLPGGELGAAVQVQDWQALATAGNESFVDVAMGYLALGTVHVLEGWDHLSFVFCLALLATGMPLLWLITAFTLGHSVSLALAHFGVLNIPIVPVEAIIALSVVFMAREALLTHSAGQVPGSVPGQVHGLRWRVALTALFGLVHGLGFASVLGSLGVSASETVTALAFFNIGVEVGQIVFVLLVLLLIWLVRQIRLERQAVQWAACVVGGMGMFWTAERVMFGI